MLGQPLIHRDQLSLLGDHNVANALAASLAVMVADRDHTTPRSVELIARGLASFSALEHRIETVGTFDGVTWINDSKSTNVASTLVALKGMTRPTVLLLGGKHKGEPYTELGPELQRTGRAVIAYGEAAPLIEQDLAGVVPLTRLGSSFDEVIATAHELARDGDVVLLSPACSSYDMFDNYEQRGPCSSSSPPARARDIENGCRRTTKATPRALRGGRRRAASAGAWAPRRAASCSSARCSRRSGSRCSTARARSSPITITTRATYFLVKQLGGVGAGIIVFAIAAKFDAEKLREWAWPIMWFTIATMAAVLVLPEFDRADDSRLAAIPVRRVVPAVGVRQARRRRVGVDADREEGREPPPPHEGARAVPRRDRRARRAGGAGARSVGGDALHVAHGAAAVRRRRAHESLHRPRRDVPADHALEDREVALRAVAPHGVSPSREARRRR